MGTIFKYRDKYVQCRSLQKKLKKMRLDESMIEIIKDDIPDDDLEAVFLSLNPTACRKRDCEGSVVELWTFSDGKNTIVSIFPDLSHLPGDHTGYVLVSNVKCEC